MKQIHKQLSSISKWLSEMKEEVFEELVNITRDNANLQVEVLMLKARVKALASHWTGYKRSQKIQMLKVFS